MIKENPHLKYALHTYLTLLENREYFDAHEILEEAWHTLRKKDHPQKNLIKGLINAAVAFEHIKRNKEDSKRKAMTVLKSFERHKHLASDGIEHYSLFKEACEKIEGLKNRYLQGGVVKDYPLLSPAKGSSAEAHVNPPPKVSSNINSPFLRRPDS